MKINSPVLQKELKLRFRSLKAFNGILFFLLALSIFAFSFIVLKITVSERPFFKPEESYQMFTFLSFLLLGLVLFITPGLTAGAISSEREKQTLPMLLTTTQSSFSIIFGKLTSSVAFLILLIISGLPIYSLVFLFGGISPSRFLTILFYLIVIVLVVGSIGIMFSTLIRRTIVSMIATYGVMLALTFVTGFLFLIFVEVSQFNTTSSANLTSYLLYFLASINPVILFGSLLTSYIEISVNHATKVDWPIWVGFLIFYSGLFIVSLAISVKKLRVNMKRYK